MRHLKTLLSMTFAVAFAASAGAQTLVKGTVLDSLSKAPEVGAVIQFIKAGQSEPVAYSVSDSLGAFSRSVSGAGDFEVLIQNMGRRTVRRSFSLPASGGEVDLGEIPLQDDAQALASATVQAMKTLVKLDVGKLTYQVEQDPDSKTGTVLDMLRKVPMVTVDGQDNITVNGSSNFKVYVDGKPNQMLSSNPSQILKVMPASAVKNIEVITNPGAKYDAEGTGGVLNLITGAAEGASKAVSDGVYGSVGVQASNRGGTGSLYLSAKKDRLTLGLNSGVGLQRLNGINALVEQKNLSSGVTTVNDHRQDQRTPYVFADLSASYEISQRNLLSGTLGLVGFNQHAWGASTISMDGLAGTSYIDDIDTRYRSNSLNGSLDFQHTSANVPGRTFTLSYRYSGNPLSAESTNLFRQLPAAPSYLQADRRTEEDDNSRENTIQFDYTTPLGEGHTLSSGLKYIRRHNSADDKLFLAGDGASWEPSAAGGMIYDHYNSIGAAYAEYSGTLGKFTATAGARYEYTWQKVEYGAGFGQDFDTSFGDFVPSASLQYTISPTRNIGLTYNRRIQRPGITYLNPFVDRSSPTSISYGNSELTSARNDMVTLVYNYFSPVWVVSLNGRYGHSGSGISQYSFYSDDILNTTYGNIVSEDNAGLSAFINWTAGPKTRIYTNSSFGFSRFSSKKLDQTNSGWNWSVMLGLQQTLPASFMLSANLMAGGKTWNLQGWNQGFTIGVLGLSKGFLDDKLKVNLQLVSNLNEGGMRIKSFSSGRDHENRSTVTVPIRQIGIGLTYNFGKQGFQVKKTRKSISNDDVINNTNGQAPGTGAGVGSGQIGM